MRLLLLPITLAGGLGACSNSSTGSGDAATGTGGATARTGGTTGSMGGRSGGGGTTAAGGTTGGTGGTTGGTGGTTVGTGGITGGTGGATTGTGGATAGTGGTTGGTGGATTSASVLQHHNDAARDGVYVDAKITKAAAGTMHIDTTFAGTIAGSVYAQPLYLAGTAGGPDLVIVATTDNRVYALNAATGLSAWNQQFGAPVTAGLCGSPLNPLGIYGTPIIDAATRTLYFDAMTNTTANGARHMVHAVAADSGTERAGWPVDLSATATSGSTAFDSPVQNQRAALALLGGKLFVPFGGHLGDCGGYHGWLVGISTTAPTQVSAWATTAFAGGVWGSSGIASDGTSLFVATGNTKATAGSGPTGSSPTSWGGGEAVIKFPATLVQPALATTTDYFFPSNWPTLDNNDTDIGGSGPVLFTVPGANPSALAMQLGKDGKAYLLNRANLGGMDAAPLTGATVSTSTVIQASVAYTTATATYVVLKGNGVGCPTGQSGGLTAVKVSAASPPALSVAWCGGGTVSSSPSVSVTSGAGANAVVWFVGGDNKLHGIDGDTGQSVFAGGTTTLAGVQRIQTPVVVNGRVFVAGTDRLFAFTP
jgi:hypothetical protein